MGRYFEDIVVGEAFVSPGRTVTEADVVAFAGLSGDFAELHTNEDLMRRSRFKGRIAHGLLGLTLSSGLATRALPPTRFVAGLGIDSWRYLRPIRIGDTIRLRITAVEKRPSASQPRAGVVVFKREILDQRGFVVQEGRTAGLIQMKRSTKQQKGSD